MGKRTRVRKPGSASTKLPTVPALPQNILMKRTQEPMVLKETKINPIPQNSQKIGKRQNTNAAMKRNKAILKTFELDKVKDIRKRMNTSRQKMAWLMKPQMIRFLQSITTTSGAYNTNQLDDETTNLTDDLYTKLNNDIAFLPATFNYFELIVYANNLVESTKNTSLPQGSVPKYNDTNAFTTWSNRFTHNTRSILILPNSVTRQSIEYIYKDNTFDQMEMEETEKQFTISDTTSLGEDTSEFGVCMEFPKLGNDNSNDTDQNDSEDCKSNAAVSECQGYFNEDVLNANLHNNGTDQNENQQGTGTLNRINPCSYFQCETVQFINELILPHIDALYTHDITTFVQFMELLSNFKFKCVVTKMVGANLITVDDASYNFDHPLHASQIKQEFNPIVRVYVIKSDNDKDDLLLMIDNIYPIQHGTRDLTPELKNVYEDLCALEFNKTTHTNTTSSTANVVSEIGTKLCKAITLTASITPFVEENSNVMKQYDTQHKITQTKPQPIQRNQRKQHGRVLGQVFNSVSNTNTKIGLRVRYEVSISELCDIINEDNVRPRTHDHEFVGNVVKNYVENELADILYVV